MTEVVILRNAGGDVDALRDDITAALKGAKDTIVIVACMDCRLNGYLDKLREQLESGTIGEKTEVWETQHADCGAMKTVVAKFTQDIDLSDEVAVTFVSPLQKTVGAELSAVKMSPESALALALGENGRLQVARLKRMGVPEKGIKNKLITARDAGELNTHYTPNEDEDLRSLIISTPSTMPFTDIAERIGREPKEAYFIQAGEPEREIAHIKLAVERLDIKDVVITARDERDIERAEKLQNVLERDLGRNIGIEVRTLKKKSKVEG